MSQPNFDLLTRAGIIAALNWIKSQTAEDSISNILVGEVIKAVLDKAPDIANLTNLELRQLKNKLESIVTGNISLSNIPGQMTVDTVDIRIEQEDYQDETITAVKNNYKSRWLLGNPEYKAYLSTTIPAQTYNATSYWTLSLPDNQYLVFGNNLGDLPAGTYLGSSNSMLSIQFGATDNGVLMNKLPVKVKMTNNIPEIPMTFSIMNWGFMREDLTSGQFKDVEFMSSQNSINAEWNIPASAANYGQNYKMPVAMAVTVKINGVEKPEFNMSYQENQEVFTLPNHIGIYVGQLQANDEVEIIFDISDLPPTEPGQD